tara:strand:- start:21 stop:686 length:666 start_codon:yes stop_codon:yes gene_type:complete
MGKSNTKLAIFDTFKTKGSGLTGEANRQRAIITILASNINSVEKTRTGISQKIAKKHGVAWKNIYSGIFRDLDEVLIPMKIAEEQGRLPMKRGPKALQELGIPYYQLTKKGLLIALAISEEKDGKELLKQFFSMSESSEKEFEKNLTKLLQTSPNFTYSIFQKYVMAYCNNKFKELLPFDLSKLKGISDESLIIQKEVITAFVKFSKRDKDNVIKFLDKIT